MEPVKDIVHVERADDLTQPQTLERIVGSVSSVVTEPLKTAGFSGSEHTLVKVVLRDGDTRRLILKRTRLNIDWTYRLSSGSRGREAALLATRDFIGVWEIFECPYVAFAESPEETALLMNDLTPFLMPDVRQPLDDRQEDLIITTLAKMHATYWKSPLLETSWLAAPSSSWQVLGPERLGQEWAMQLLHPGMRETVRHG